MREKVLFVRVEEEIHSKFLEKCDSMGRQYSGLIREIMVAFNEDRLRIRQKGEFYEPV